jgi:small ligand-binding sensory domain FIST
MLQTSKAHVIVVEDGDWQIAAENALTQLQEFGQPDLLFMFASYSYGTDTPALLKTIYEKSGTGLLVGCTGQGVIGAERELENRGGLTLLALNLPGATLRATHITEVQQNLPGFSIGGTTGASRLDTNAWLLLCDPFSFDATALLGRFESEFPTMPLVGGMASGDFYVRQTFLFHNGTMLEEGALLVGVGGAYTVQPVVSQGATPIGSAWMVTESRGRIIDQISGRTAYQILVETVRGLPPEQQRKVTNNLLIGLAVDEYKSEFGRGDYIIRGLEAVDPHSGAIAVNDYPRVGQTIQFQLRDAEAADEDLRALLTEFRQNAGDNLPVGGVLFSCNGRGMNMFPEPHHDARTISQEMNGLPLAGFFCNGEIGPIGKKNFLHGFTASLGLFVEVKK